MRLLVYTSLLRADRSGLSLAGEHRETEDAIRASSLPSVLLRNGWYMENYTENLAPALQQGAIVGCARDGRVAVCSEPLPGEDGWRPMDNGATEVFA